MGWCPHAKANEAKRRTSLENFDSNILDRARGESGDAKSLGWLRKASTRTLLVCTILTLMYLLLISQLGINPILLLTGLFIALFMVIFQWKAKMQLYAGLVKQPFIDHSNMEKLCTILAFALYPGIVFLYITGREPAMQAMFSFFGGFLTYFLVWLSPNTILGKEEP